MKRLFQFIVVFTLFFTISLSAKILHVYESGGATAIQDSINSASLSDTVMVHNGKYYIGDLADTSGLRLHLKKLMSVSPDSAPHCTLTGLSSDGLDTAIHVIRNIDTLEPYPTYYYPIIQGFTITEGQGCHPIPLGGGVYVTGYTSGSASFKCGIYNNIIVKNRDGIHVFGDFFYASDTIYIEITGNKIINSYGAGVVVEAMWGENMTHINNNLICKNQHSGVLVAHYSSVEITNNLIRHNLGYGGFKKFGGGIYVESFAGGKKVKDKRWDYKPTVIKDNLIENNTASVGGGVYVSRYLSAKINNNVFYRNKATSCAAICCGFIPYDSSQTITGSSNVIVGNIGSNNIYMKRDSIRLHNNLIVDNCGPIAIENELTQSNITNSNIYYNTYQDGDREVYNYYHPADLRDNFWWYTDSIKIASLIRGYAGFMPFNNWFEPEAPGEPEAVYSVMNYNSGYSTVVDYLGDPDTLYLEIMGHDRHPEYREAAVAILKSNIYRSGIAVGLLETDKGTGVYRGEAYVRHTSEPDSIRDDDIHQIIRVNPNYDTIKVIANIDNSKHFKIYYRCQGGVKEEDRDELTIRPLRSTTTNPSFKFFLPEEGNVNLSIYDVSGRKLEETVSSRMNKGWHRIESGIDKVGVYLYRLKFEGEVEAGKVVVVK